MYLRLLFCLIATLLPGLLSLSPCLGAPLAIIMPDWKTVPITEHDLGNGLHVIESFGGNIGAFVGAQGSLVVDTGYPQLSPRIADVLGKLSSSPVRLVIDTHFHWDHTGANAYFSHRGAIVIASSKTREHLVERQASKDNRPGEFPPDPYTLPALVLDRDTTLFWNGQTIHLLLVPTAHTDGDIVVQFVEANAIQTGDTFTNGFYPFIDVKHGGSIDGMIALCRRVLAMSNERTHIVPGHGPIATPHDVMAFTDMLSTVRQRVAAAISRGMTADQFVAGNPLADLDKRWGGNLVKGPVFSRIVYDDLHRRLPTAR